MAKYGVRLASKLRRRAKMSYKVSFIILIALLCLMLCFCAWSGSYFNDDWLEGLVGGFVGCVVATGSGCLFAYAINKYT